MVKVRLARAGSKKRPFYHLVVTDKENPRDGRFIEQIGYYDPARPISEARVDHDRLAYWVSVGAQVSPRVHKVAKDHAKAAPQASPGEAAQAVPPRGTAAAAEAAEQSEQASA